MLTYPEPTTLRIVYYGSKETMPSGTVNKNGDIIEYVHYSELPTKTAPVNEGYGSPTTVPRSDDFNPPPPPPNSGNPQNEPTTLFHAMKKEEP